LANPNASESSKVGAIKEILVATDLLKRGWEVYRAMSPAAGCDLVAIRGPLVRRVEVKSAGRKIGKLRRNTWLFSNKRLRWDRYDVLALVDHDQEIYYRTVDIVGYEREIH